MIFFFKASQDLIFGLVIFLWGRRNEVVLPSLYCDKAKQPEIQENKF